MIQTITLKKILSGANLLIVNKEIKSPSGRDNIKVSKNSSSVTPKPSNKLRVTVKKSIIIVLLYLFCLDFRLIYDKNFTQFMRFAFYDAK